MSKYIDADLLRKEIEKRMHICDGVFERDSDTYYQGKAVAYGELLAFIDSLPEEKPSEDLEEERLYPKGLCETCFWRLHCQYAVDNPYEYVRTCEDDGGLSYTEDI